MFRAWLVVLVAALAVQWGQDPGSSVSREDPSPVQAQDPAKSAGAAEKGEGAKVGGAAVPGAAAAQGGEPREATARRAAPPLDRSPLPPVQEPFRTPVERRDLIQRFTPSSPLEGFYELRRIVHAGRVDLTEVKGYLAIGRSHLSLLIEQTSEDAGVQTIQSGFRRYVLDGNRLVMTALCGFSAQGNDVELDPVGLTETRGYALLGTVLRIHQAETSYMEFVRLE